MNTAIKHICLVVSAVLVLGTHTVLADDYAATANPADMNVSEAIKMKLDGDTSLSREARNLEVITTDTTVLLRGTVASQAEAQKVQGYAQAYAGDHQVKTEITVAAQ
jgi:osmotically-inducible protein OsmY